MEWLRYEILSGKSGSVVSKLFFGGIPAHLSISTVYLGGAEGPPNFGFGRSTRPEAFCNKKLFLEISQNSQENTCNRVSF